MAFFRVASLVMNDVIDTVLDSVLAEDPGGIIGIYLYGSSTTTGLGPESDIDLLLVTRRSLTASERTSLISILLGLSGWRGHVDVFPEVADRRPLEVTSLVVDDLDPLPTAPRRDFQFGEWLRGDFVQGVEPAPEHDLDVVTLLATALASNDTLYGPPLDEVVPAVPRELLVDSQRAALPGLVDELPEDARNVLLTLARMLHTVETGAIVSKPYAAELAAQRVEADDADLLRAAAREYRGEGQVDWQHETSRVSGLAESLVALIRRSPEAV